MAIYGHIRLSLCIWLYTGPYTAMYVHIRLYLAIYIITYRPLAYNYIYIYIYIYITYRFNRVQCFHEILLDPALVTLDEATANSDTKKPKTGHG